MLVLDTNVLIAYLSPEAEVAKQLHTALENKVDIILPTIAIAEVLGYPHISDSVCLQTELLISTLSVQSLDLKIAELAAELRRNSGLKLIDCVIAATALSLEGTLVTRDREFKKIKELEVIEW